MIRSLTNNDIPYITKLAIKENFAPGLGDVNIYRNTDKQGLWVGCLNSKVIGCIAGIKYNQNYGFVGLFIVDDRFRGKGFGLQLWKHIINHLKHVNCLGIEAAPDRITDYQTWGFMPSSITTRWRIDSTVKPDLKDSYSININDYLLLEGSQIPQDIIQKYDSTKEYTPRPHFLSDWLSNTDGKVLALVNQSGICVGFGRIRTCLLKEGRGHRIGPLIADNHDLACFLLQNLIKQFPGIILVDSPGINIDANILFTNLNFQPISYTVRMYKGEQPTISMKEIYGLACLELG